MWRSDEVQAWLDALPSAAVIDQIIAAARARRPRDRTNAERRRRFRQRRRVQRLRADSIGKENTPA